MAYDGNERKPIIDGMCECCGSAFEYTELGSALLPDYGRGRGSSTNVQRMICDPCQMEYMLYNKAKDEYYINLKNAKRQWRKDNQE